MDMFYPPEWRREDKIPDDFDPNEETMSADDIKAELGCQKYHQMVDEGYKYGR